MSTLDSRMIKGRAALDPGDRTARGGVETDAPIKRRIIALTAVVSAVAVLTMLAGQPSAGASTASETTPEQVVSFTYHIAKLQKGRTVLVTYVSGTSTEKDVLLRPSLAATAESGGLGSVDAVADGFAVAANSPDSLVEVTDKLLVQASPLEGRAYIPDGTAVTVTNEQSHQTIEVKNGTFSIPTGVPGGSVAATASDPDTVTFTAFGAPKLALTGPGSTGGPVTLSKDTGDASQIWKFSDPGNPSVTRITNKKTGFCLGVEGGSDGSAVIAAQCDDSKNQLWVHGGESNGSYRLLSESSSRPSLVMSASVGSTDIEVAKITGDELQEWLERSAA